ncbi:hypothetical protein [Paraburkholderia antibiotica]|uniref:Uncharacterized protein n=1 Tax=Paraburkholderia antibiotica TaxID=2728839 RepID=A0A7X9ZXE0_9BURK|nr:hypothetical protein [Paraburkholderia antibiotica]NML30535.1 hypothetical protein [Paraburkholderia antibiotica]
MQYTPHARAPPSGGCRRRRKERNDPNQPDPPNAPADPFTSMRNAAHRCFPSRFVIDPRCHDCGTGPPSSIDLIRSNGNETHLLHAYSVESGRAIANTTLVRLRTPPRDAIMKANLPLPRHRRILVASSLRRRYPHFSRAFPAPSARGNRSSKDAIRRMPVPPSRLRKNRQPATRTSVDSRKELS